MDIESNLARFHGTTGGSADRDPNSRDASFDFCFNYFQSFRDREDIAAIAAPEWLEVSCLQLGFYLASWGMYRGSTQLIKRSSRHLAAVVQVFSATEPAIWNLDLDGYNEAAIEALLTTAEELRRANGGMTDTLVTKVMLGVFGNVPAFDRNFCRGFHCSTFGKKSLRRISTYYQKHSEAIDASRITTYSFKDGLPTKRLYTRAKMLDMVFFVEGQS